MIHGHGDDLHLYGHIVANFSSNVFTATHHTDLVQHIAAHLGTCVASYPEPEPTTLQRELAARLGYHPEQILVTNGATEAIYLLAMLTRGSLSHIVQPTFSEYADACRLYDHKLTTYDEAAVLWCCNPNNPTGRLCDETLLSAQKWVIVDRSYQYFARQAMYQPTRESLETNQYVYIHSLTKRYRIPGLRLGYILAPSQVIAQIKALRQPWSVNAVAIEAGRWIVAHGFPETIDRLKLWSECDRLAAEIRALGYEVEPTDTHFMLVRTPHLASELKQYLASRHGLLIRDASNFATLSPYHIRIATQSPHDNDLLLAALNTYAP